MLAEAYLTTANKESAGQIMKCVILQAIFAVWYELIVKSFCLYVAYVARVTSDRAARCVVHIYMTIPLHCIC